MAKSCGSATRERKVGFSPDRVAVEDSCGDLNSVRSRGAFTASHPAHAATPKTRPPSRRPDAYAILARFYEELVRSERSRDRQSALR